MSACGETSRTIERWLEGEAPPEALAAADAHAAACAECARELVSARALAGALEAALAGPAPEGGPEAVLSAIARGGAETARRQPARPGAQFRAVLAIAASVLLLGSLGSVFAVKDHARRRLAEEEKNAATLNALQAQYAESDRKHATLLGSIEEQERQRVTALKNYDSAKTPAEKEQARLALAGFEQRNKEFKFSPEYRVLRAIADRPSSIPTEEEERARLALLHFDTALGLKSNYNELVVIDKGTDVDLPMGGDAAILPDQDTIATSSVWYAFTKPDGSLAWDGVQDVETKSGYLFGAGDGTFSSNVPAEGGLTWNVAADPAPAPANPMGPVVGSIERFLQAGRAQPNRAPVLGLAGGDLGSGALRSDADGAAFPLEHTDVKAEISGFLASTLVEQRFANPYDKKIEATYCFPLPQTAAVSDFVMQIGERTIRGVVRERAEARRIYEAAKAQGQVVSLLEQQRPNVFVQSVANIEPGKRVDVRIRFFHTVPCDQGKWSYVLPMVVGHRYGSDTRTPDHSTVTPPRLEPGKRAASEVSLSIDVDAGLPIEGLGSPTHEIAIERVSPTRARVRLADRETIPDRDFVLEYRLGTERETTLGLLAHASDRGRFFTLVATPPFTPGDDQIVPREIFFILDSSGSMNGVPIEQSKRFMRRALAGMRPYDVFNVATFSGDARLMSEEFLAATPGNVGAASKWVDALAGEGGTEAEKGIRLALEHPRDPRRVRIVVFLTDGCVSFEGDIFARIKASRAGARVFSFGVGSAPNRYLLDRMAEFGRGAATYIGHDEPEESIARKVDDFYRKIDAPVLVDVSVDWGGLAVEDVYPKEMPDLFAGEKLVIYGRFARGGIGVLTVRGLAGGRPFERKIPIALPEAEPRREALASVWARMRLKDIEDRLAGAAAPAAEPLVAEAKRVALDFGLASAWTSFVAVDSASDTAASGAPVPVAQPVPVPAGVDPANFQKETRK